MVRQNLGPDKRLASQVPPSPDAIYRALIGEIKSLKEHMQTQEQEFALLVRDFGQLLNTVRAHAFLLDQMQRYHVSLGSITDTLASLSEEYLRFTMPQQEGAEAQPEEAPVQEQVQQSDEPISFDDLEKQMGSEGEPEEEQGQPETPPVITPQPETKPTPEAKPKKEEPKIKAKSVTDIIKSLEDQKK